MDRFEYNVKCIKFDTNFPTAYTVRMTQKKIRNV